MKNIIITLILLLLSNGMYLRKPHRGRKKQKNKRKKEWSGGHMTASVCSSIGGESIHYPQDMNGSSYMKE